MTAAQMRELDELGYTLVPGLIGGDWLHELRARVEALFEEEGENAGHEFKQEPHARRLANLVDKGEVFERVVNHPLLLEMVQHVLGSEYKLSSLNARSTNPFAPESQPLDNGMDAGMGLLPGGPVKQSPDLPSIITSACPPADAGGWDTLETLAAGERPDQPPASSGGHAQRQRDFFKAPGARGASVCNSVWMLDDFSADSGAMRVVPGSHTWGRQPSDDMADPLAPHPAEVLINAPAGSVAVYNAHLWHGGTANRTNRHRRALHCSFARSDQPQRH